MYVNKRIKMKKNKKIESILLYLAILGGIIAGLKTTFDMINESIYPGQKVHIANNKCPSDPHFFLDNSHHRE